MALHNEGLDDPRITAVLLHAATEGKDPNAAAAVAQLHESSSSVKALFAALGTPPNTDSRMMNILTSMNVDDPRLMAAYIDQARHGSSDAILALGKYPLRKEAVAALFDAPGTSPGINLTAMKVLTGLKVDDPRLVEAWITTANTYGSTSAAALLRKAPFSPDIIACLLTHLQDSLHRPQNWVTQIDLGLLLQGGEASHQALHTYLASAETSAQALIAVAWLEIDHSAAAKAEILQTVRVADVRAAMLRVTTLSAKGYVSVPGYPSMEDECFNGLGSRVRSRVLV